MPTVGWQVFNLPNSPNSQLYSMSLCTSLEIHGGYRLLGCPRIYNDQLWHYRTSSNSREGGINLRGGRTLLCFIVKKKKILWLPVDVCFSSVTSFSLPQSSGRLLADRLLQSPPSSSPMSYLDPSWPRPLLLPRWRWPAAGDTLGFLPTALLLLLVVVTLLVMWVLFLSFTEPEMSMRGENNNITRKQ